MNKLSIQVGYAKSLKMFDGAKYKCYFIYLLLVKAKALLISLNSENIS